MEIPKLYHKTNLCKHDKSQYKYFALRKSKCYLENRNHRGTANEDNGNIL